MPAWTSTRSPGCTGPTSSVLTVSIPAAVRTVGVVVLAADDLTEAALVRADDARLLARRRGLEQPRVLEADVGELPEDVVAEHEPAVVAGGRIVAEPDHVLGRAIERASDPTPRWMVVRPHASARRRAPAMGWSPPRDNDEDVPGAGHRPQSRGRVVVDERHRGKRSRADDDGVHELDGDVLGVLRCARRPAPQRAAGREPSSQGERRGREARRGSAELVAVMTIRHVAPPAPGRQGADLGWYRCRPLPARRTPKADADLAPHCAEPRAGDRAISGLDEYKHLRI